MKIGGFQKFSLLEYPGRICAVIFTQGCNFRCPYCHNPELVKPYPYSETLPAKEVLAFLKERIKQLDAVTITGGEPTIQPELVEFIGRIKRMNYLVKIDTNGSHPGILEHLIHASLIDFIAMDIKAPLEKYSDITQCNIQPDLIRKSIKLIMNSGLPYEFRTTAVKTLLSKEDFIHIGELIQGASTYCLQMFVPSRTLDPSLSQRPCYTRPELDEISKQMQDKVQFVHVR